MKKFRVYADTSVIGGCFDDEFRDDSLRFIDSVRGGRHLLLLSEIVIAELEKAPEDVIALLRTLPQREVERVPIDANVLYLRDAYLKARILTPRWADDAAHVAAATVARADAIVSWNFRHIVRLDKMKAYNRINVLEGYGILTIVTPKEVVAGAEDD